MIIKKIIKNLIFLIKYKLHYYIKLRIINKFDKEKSFYDKNNISELLINGYQIFNFRDFFGFSIKDFINVDDINKDVYYDKFGHFKSFEINEELLAKIINSKKLIKILRSYINEHVRLDNAYLDFQKNTNIKGFSQGWHKDDVGKRIKIFFCIETQGKPSSTNIISPKNNFANTFLLELERFFTLNNIKKHVLEKEIPHEEGFFVMFDTGITHRGNTKIQDGVRKSLVLEFIDRRKSNKIYKYSSCGPGYGENRFIEFGKKSIEEIKNSPLIDEEMLTIKNDKIRYEIKDNNI